MIEQKASCIVLGGGGFIGTNLCRRLVASGHRVRAFGRRSLFPQALEGTEWFQGDFSDPAALAGAIETFDIVFHLIHGATPQSANLDMVGDLERNVVSSLRMLEICQKLGVSRVVFVSSGGTIYGCPDQIPTPETAPTNPITAYGVSKLAIEKYFALYNHIYGLDYCILRVTNPYGPFQTPLKNQGVIAALVARGIQNEKIEIWGDGLIVRDFVFIDDVVDGLVAAMLHRGSERIFNIGSGEGRNIRELIAEIERLLERKLDVQWKPGRPVDVPVSVLVTHRAREVLGWKSKTSFEEGLNKTVAWWHSEKIHR